MKILLTTLLVLLTTHAQAAKPPEPTPGNTVTHVQYYYELKMPNPNGSQTASPSVSIEIPDGYYLQIDRLLLQGFTWDDARVWLVLDLMLDNTTNPTDPGQILEFLLPVNYSHPVPTSGYVQQRGTEQIELGLQVRNIIRLYAHKYEYEGPARVSVMLVGYLVQE